MSKATVLPADPMRLRMIVHNLLANATSYTEHGGAIVVSNDATALAVWDSGPQLDPAHLDRIFDRLWRADLARTDATTHARIGLSLARARGQHADGPEGRNHETGGLQFLLTPRG